MSSMAREWMQKFESLKRGIQSNRINGMGLSAEEQKTMLGTVGLLEQQLKIMTSSALQYEISVSELARRQVLIDNLKKTIPATASSSSILHADRASSPGGTAAYTGGKGGGVGNNPLHVSDKGLMQRQKEVMAQQDLMMLDIEKGVGRLHEKALTIGDEAKMHNRLLDDLDTNVDIATAALQEEARHAQEIKDKARVCWLYVCIAVEVVILVIIMFVAFMG